MRDLSGKKVSGARDESQARTNFLLLLLLTLLSNFSPFILVTWKVGERETEREREAGLREEDGWERPKSGSSTFLPLFHFIILLSCFSTTFSPFHSLFIHSITSLSMVSLSLSFFLLHHFSLFLHSLWKTPEPGALTAQPAIQFYQWDGEGERRKGRTEERKTRKKGRKKEERGRKKVMRKNCKEERKTGESSLPKGKPKEMSWKEVGATYLLYHLLSSFSLSSICSHLLLVCFCLSYNFSEGRKWVSIFFQAWSTDPTYLPAFLPKDYVTTSHRERERERELLT